MSKCLAIVEVSQKQAYIFASNKLQDNIKRSEEIVRVTSKDYFSEKCKEHFNPEKNYVYSGGGHTILEFDSKDEAISFNKELTVSVMKDYPDMELFVTVREYDEDKKPSENLKELIKQLEAKKAERRSSFGHGSFGIEKIDSYSLSLVRVGEKKGDTPSEKNSMVPEGFRPAYHFEDLGGTVGESSFIAIVHIDGNGMGKRVNDLYGSLDETVPDWEEYKEKIRSFSDSIDRDFKDSFKEMGKVVADAIKSGSLKNLSLKDDYFPIRKIIMSGDDVCFVSEGRIGIECSRLFIERLREKTNSVDKKGYEACAGVAMVHRKYPFFRAYELAESLCSNAKRMCASIDKDNNGALLSAVDWHISFGELGDTTEDIRSDYITDDGRNLELRPYLIGGDTKAASEEPLRRYANFSRLIGYLQSEDQSFARSTIKQLRNELKKGLESTENYLKFHKIQELVSRYYYDIFEKRNLTEIGSGEHGNGKLFIKTSDGKQRSILFDAIEVMDTYLPIGEVKA